MDGSPPAPGDGSEIELVLVDGHVGGHPGSSHFGFGVFRSHRSFAPVLGGPVRLSTEGGPFVCGLGLDYTARRRRSVALLLSRGGSQRRGGVIPEAPAEDPPAFIRPGAKRAATSTSNAGRLKVSSQQPKAKKPTIAQLATSLESILTTLPVLTQQMEDLSQRTKAMESSVRDPRLSALSKPFGESCTLGSKDASRASPAALLKEMPQPQAASKMRQLRLVPVAGEEDALALTSEQVKDVDPSDMFKAMFAQSSAVTALAAQIASFGG